MRLLLDECVPRPLRHELPGHQVSTVVEMGWSSKRNGELLALVRAERFDAILTVDQNLSFQQNLRSAGVAVLLVVARTNRLKELRPLVPAILAALATLTPGEYVEVGASPALAADGAVEFWPSVLDSRGAPQQKRGPLG